LSPSGLSHKPLICRLRSSVPAIGLDTAIPDN